MSEPQPSPEAQVIAIRAALIDTYGEDYAGEDAAAEIERLFHHLGEHEANVQRILQAKNEALEKALAERDEAQRELAATMTDRDAWLLRATRAEYHLEALAAPQRPEDAPTATV